MSKHRPYLGRSEAQSNAEALYRRDHTYTEASAGSFRVAWDWHNRQPDDLRDAVRMVRRAYADEVPGKLHEGYDSIGEGGTPKMAGTFLAYLEHPASTDDPPIRCLCDRAAGEHHAGDCPAHPRNRPLISYLRYPFRALLDGWSRGGEGQRKRAAIVAHVAIGRTGPRAAAIAEGVPEWCARVVAEDALRSFLRSLSDVRVNAAVDDGTAAA